MILGTQKLCKFFRFYFFSLKICENFLIPVNLSEVSRGIPLIAYDDICGFKENTVFMSLTDLQVDN